MVLDSGYLGYIRGYLGALGRVGGLGFRVRQLGFIGLWGFRASGRTRGLNLGFRADGLGCGTQCWVKRLILIPTLFKHKRKTVIIVLIESSSR